MFRRKQIFDLALLVVLSLFVAYWSILYIRPYKGVVGNLCEKTAENPAGYCFEALPSGGFPFAFMFDNGDVSVVGSLSWIEDDFILIPFIANWCIYFVLFLLLHIAYRKFKARSV